MKKRTKKLLLFGGLAFSLPAAGQSVALKEPERNFGYLVGDLVTTEVVVTTRENERIDRRSLPVPGPLNASIELRHMDIRETLENGARTTILHLEYQSFFAPEQVMSAELPAFDVRFASSVAHVPAWPFHVSPLRVAQRSIDALADLHGNLAIAPRSGTSALTGLLVSSGLALTSAIVFAGMLGWLPGLRRNRQPFAQAAHKIATLQNPKTQTALQALLHAMDCTDGRHVFAEDLDGFLLRHSSFADMRSDIEYLFALSRRYFFEPDHAPRERGTEFAEIVALAKSLRRAERRWR